MKSENVDEKKGLIVRELARLSEITPAAAAASIVPARGDVGASADLGVVGSGAKDNPISFADTSDDEIRALAPDVVLLSSEPYPFSAAHIAEVQALAPGARIVLADGEAFSWYGSRLRRTPGVLASLRGHLVG